MAKVTPARKQYLDIKSQYPDCILFFRLGDFYEMFDDDAIVVSRELDLTLTKRRHSSDSPAIPMAGVPYHAAENYIARLIEKGYHVAVCDQISEPTGKGIVERDVTRVVTPGTIIEPELLKDKQSNYLMAIVPFGDAEQMYWSEVGIAYTDISTGEFKVTEFRDENVGALVLEELSRLNPREVLLPETWITQGVSMPEGIHLTSVMDWQFEQAQAHQVLLDHFGVTTLDGWGLQGKHVAICAAGGLLQYLRKTQRNSLAQLVNLQYYSTDSFMVLDQFTRRNLELTETIRSRKTKGSLLGVLDRTVTGMGARLLRSWVAQPLLEAKRIQARLNAVEALTADEASRQNLKEALKSIADLERLINRVILQKAGPRDLLSLQTSLEYIPVLKALVKDFQALNSLNNHLDPCDEIYQLVREAIQEDAPATLNQIGFIQAGYSKELDQVLASTREAREWIANLETVEKAATGINTLKVGYNKVFGYYIEITKAQSEHAPEHYIRKQTLVNAERYITPELKEYETLVLNAEEQILETERTLFEGICKTIGEQSHRVLKTAQAIAHIDAFLSLATVAVREAYVKPEISEDKNLYIREGRHPVVEGLLVDGERYTPNDTRFTVQERVHIITGPNMSGKSTYIRQVALITLMAQIGSFVPADEAKIGIVDRIFARIGAQDEIHAGQSTFMVEMVETARVLSGSSDRSLLILDEIGRGTSTYDGLAIARSVIEYIHNHPRLNCRTLFATHYHELTELSNVLPRTSNYNVVVSEQGEEIVFLHKVVPGGADQSYGIHVAQLAGMPRPVVERAKELLRHLESSSGDFSKKEREERNINKGTETQQLSFFETQEPNAVEEALRQVDIDHLSPIEALTKLYELKRLID